MGRLIFILLLPTVVSLTFYLLLAWHFGQLLFLYLPWNLFLAWIPLVFAVSLVAYIRYNAWSSWPAISLTLLWLLFLPNSFYIMTDFVHLGDIYAEDIGLVAILFTLFVFTGLLLGFTSLYLIHKQLEKRLKTGRALAVVMVILAVCSWALYIGRDLRRNSWDVLMSPSGLLFDLSDKAMSPSEYSSITGQVLSYFIALVVMYVVIWQALKLSRPSTL